MGRGTSRIIALLVALALAGTLSGCGGGDAAPEPAPSEPAAAATEEAPAAEEAVAEEPAEAAEEVPRTGDGPIHLDAGFYALDVPEGVKCLIKSSPALGQAARAEVQLFVGADTALRVLANKTSRIESLDDAVESVNTELGRLSGKIRSKPTDLEMGGRTYKQILFEYGTGPMESNLVDYEADGGYYIWIVLQMDEKGKEFLHSEQVEAVLDSIEFKQP